MDRVSRRGCGWCHERASDHQISQPVAGPPGTSRSGKVGMPRLAREASRGRRSNTAAGSIQHHVATLPE